MTIERINELITRKSLTKDERNEVIAAADEAGIKYTIKKGCSTCYETILLKLYEAQVTDMNVSIDGYKLKRVSQSFRIGGMLVNNDTIKGLEVKKMHPVIVSAYFEKVKKNKEVEDADSEV